MFEEKCYEIINGNMLEELDKLEENLVDSIVTDPPYELNFMSKGWDNAGVSFQKETWKKCLRVLKPGGYLLAFGGSRTFHRIAVAIEDAGFEIRDTIMWLYGSGFPKSLNIGLAIDKKEGVESDVVGVGVSGTSDTHTRCMSSETKDGKSVFGGEYEIKKAKNQWDGWGTALKPSFEPVIVARKPLEGSCVDNVIKYGVGGINVDECRIDFVDDVDYKITADKNQHEKFGTKPMTNNNVYGDYSMVQPKNYNSTGRFPANTILTYDDTDYNEVCGGFPYTINSKRSSKNNKDTEYTNTYTPPKAIYTDDNTYGDEGSASRYFYCAKASAKDRDEGLDSFEEHRKAGYGYDLGFMNAGEGMFKDRKTLKKNIHPTVKPTTLMQYLVRLVTPKGGIVLDPFNGSGSTGKAVMFENRERNANYKYIGVELSQEYCEIANARIFYALNNYIYEPEINESDKKSISSSNDNSKSSITLW